MTNKEKMIRILCDALDGCPLTYPCNKLWSPEGWCKDHCKAGQQEPDAECWLKYAEVMTSEALQAQDVPDTNVGDMISRQANCVYCHEDSDGYVKPIEKNCHAFICFGMDGWELSLKANGWHGSAKIRYCPMCGRELKR